MRPRQQTARHRRPALINTSQRSEGAWESCLARNAACGRGRFLLNGVGATRQGPRCQVALGRGCNRWRGPSAKETMASVRRHHERDMQDRDVTTLSVEAEHPPRGSADGKDLDGLAQDGRHRRPSRTATQRWPLGHRQRNTPAPDRPKAGLKRQGEASPVPRSHRPRRKPGRFQNRRCQRA